MSAFWSQLKRGTSVAVLACWVWLSMGSAFTHACGQGNELHGSTIRADIACVSCQWASVEKSTDVQPAPTRGEQPLLSQVFAELPEAHPYVPSLILPARAPPA